MHLALDNGTLQAVVYETVDTKQERILQTALLKADYTFYCNNEILKQTPAAAFNVEDFLQEKYGRFSFNVFFKLYIEDETIEMASNMVQYEKQLTKQQLFEQQYAAFPCPIIYNVIHYSNDVEEEYVLQLDLPYYNEKPTLVALNQSDFSGFNKVNDKQISGFARSLATINQDYV